MERISALLLVALLPFTLFTQSNSTAQSTVYFSRDITPQNIAAVFDATGWKGKGNIAFKMGTD